MTNIHNFLKEMPFFFPHLGNPTSAAGVRFRQLQSLQIISGFFFTSIYVPILLAFQCKFQMNICANVKYISVQDSIKSVGVSRGVSSVYLSQVCADFPRTSVQFPSVFICASQENVFPYKEVFHLSACHQQTTVEPSKPQGRLPGRG